MNPLTLRQSFQTANLEALREAQGFNDLLVREAVQKRILDDRTAQEQSNVPEIPKAEGMRAEERKGRQGQRQAPEDEGPNERPDAEASSQGGEFSASGGLDLLV